jgi:iron complex outermembrane recepter protein
MNKIFLFFLFLISHTALVAQKTQFRGTVKDALDGQPVVGATVANAAGGGTSTDASGAFSLAAAAGDRITISSTGYVPQTITAGAAPVSVSLSPSSSSLDAVVVTGTRSANRTALNTPVPVDIIPLRTVQGALPQNDLNQMLTYLAPSFQSNRQSASDGTEHIDPASLRGLGPDQTLVLVNGKRRHTSSLLNNQGTFGNGSVGTDLNTIPVAALERVEVLRDGAAAQYGSDAIAGVVNLVLKSKADGISLSATAGATREGDGQLTRLMGNYGVRLGNQGGTFNLSADAYVRGKTNRTQNHDLIIFDQSAQGNFFSYLFTGDPAASRAYDDSVLTSKRLTRDDFNFSVGDAKITNYNLFYNLNLPFGGGNGEFYSFGGYNARKGEGFGFRRLPSDYSKMVFELFPNGFQPNTGSDIQDVSIALGARYDLSGWKLDLSNTLGSNQFDYSVNNTVNASLQSKSPTSFKAGGHEFLQNTVNADLSRYYGSVLSGFNLALGGEFRLERYQINPGEEGSWRNYGLFTNANGEVTDTLGLAGGAQSFPGFSPANATDASRNNISLYADTELDITDAWTLGLAGRFEQYSDFGSTFNYKAATKYNFNSKLVLRAAASTGFRAPSLHQQNFSYVSTTILSDGRLGQSGFFKNDSELAKSLGIPELTQETSKNLSFGLTLKPVDNFSLSVDAYRIRVKDRIVLTGLFGYDPFGSPDSAIQALFLPFGADGGRFFTNAINTTTQGIDVVANYRLGLGKSTLDITALANFNRTEVDDAFNIPAKLKGQEDIFFSPAERGLIEGVNPREKFNLILNYKVGRFSAMLSNVYFGRVSRNGFPFGVVQEFSGKVVTDASLTYGFAKGFSLTVGANNLWNKYPDEQKYENSYFGVFKYAPVQMGMNGAFYFARLNYAFSL